MRVELLRRNRIQPDGGDAMAESAPINDALGLRRDDQYLNYFSGRWGAIVSPDQVEEILEADLPGRLGDATAETRDGHIPYAELAAWLEGIRFGADEIEVATFAQLAAWSLERVVHRGELLLSVCESCGCLWFGQPRRDFRYCNRPARGQALTCAQVESHKRFSANREAWDKEYRRVYQRKLRGTISARDWGLWRRHNGPDDWTRFEQWLDAYQANLRRGAEQDVRGVVDDLLKEENDG